MHKTPEQWSAVKPDAVLTGSHAQVLNVLTMALEDIQSLAATHPTQEGVKDDEYLVWSNEHCAWWRANSCGYTVHVEAAGVYGRDEALKISHKGRDGWTIDRRPDEVPIRLSDLPEHVRAALAKHKEGK